MREQNKHSKQECIKEDLSMVSTHKVHGLGPFYGGHDKEHDQESPDANQGHLT